MATSKTFFSVPLANYSVEAFQPTYGSFEDQQALIHNLNTKYVDISGSINKYSDKLFKLDNNYKDFSKDSVIDSTRIWLDKVDRKSTSIDGVKEDIQIMIREQNNAYIIGMITLATVLITTYLVIKK